MTFRQLIQLINTDMERYIALGTKSRIKIFLFYQAFWASFFYRFYDYLYLKTKGRRFIRIFVALFYHFGFKLIQIFTGISIPAGTKIGKGLHLAHYGPIIVSGGSVLGNNCNLGNQVIIGFGRKAGVPGHPSLGDRVFVGPGAKIFGPIKIGNDVAIGANAVVTSDVPDRAVVAGIPAKVINYHGSFFYIRYLGMEQDVARQESWELACQMDPSLVHIIQSFVQDEN